MKETLKRKRHLTLNTVPYWRRSYGKKQNWKTHEIFHYRGEVKLTGKETDMSECKECHKILPMIAYTTAGLRSDGAYYPKKICRQCATIVREEQRTVVKNAPPKPERCECCHKKDKLLHVDHIHGSFVFRGWLCKGCNTGMGLLGDDLGGLLQAAVFLENDTNKIIEKLHEVSSDIFSRKKE